MIPLAIPFVAAAVYTFGSMMIFDKIEEKKERKRKKEKQRRRRVHMIYLTVSVIIVASTIVAGTVTGVRYFAM